MEISGLSGSSSYVQLQQIKLQKEKEKETQDSQEISNSATEYTQIDEEE